jgi:hypothetical protein
MIQMILALESNQVMKLVYLSVEGSLLLFAASYDKRCDNLCYCRGEER